MKKTITILFILLFSISFAQERSAKIQVINGEKFYMHTVKPGETIYSLSKLYDVKQREIAEANFDVTFTLQAGEVIKIPVAETKEENTDFYSDNNFIYHKVKKDQTLYNLAKLYEVYVDDITKVNPRASAGIKEGDIIKIPKEKIRIEGYSKKTENTTLIKHIVKNDETLFYLAEHYGIDMQDIIDLNPGVEDGLYPGQLVEIPESKKSTFQQIKPDTNRIDKPVTFTIESSFFSSEDDPCMGFDYQEYDKPFKVALLLPLYLDENDMLDTLTVGRNETKPPFYKNTAKMLEFYEGCLIAADSLRKAGLDFELFVYDTGRDIEKVRKIIQRPEMQHMDLLIGPVYSSNMKTVADFAREYQINMISPLSQKDEITRYNPYVFQVNTSERVDLAQMSKYLAKYHDKSIVVVHNNTIKEQDRIKILKEELKNSLHYENAIDVIVFKEINFYEGGIEAVEDALSVGMENFVVVLSDEEVFVTDIVTRLNILAEEYKILLFGMPKWQRFTNIELEYLYKLQLHYYSATSINYEKQDVKNFVLKYRNLMKSEPGYFSFRGYDVMFYFMNALKKYGKSFQYCLAGTDTPVFDFGLQSQLNFRKVSSFGGFENKTVYLMRYDREYNIHEVDVNKKYEYFFPEEYDIDDWILNDDKKKEEKKPEEIEKIEKKAEAEENGIEEPYK